ncbi:MAG: hypothetical protein EXQ52_12415 [Bryobacterales bacterium]|nr:hypothetical protein [Bryobacterales bacterium]
MIKVEMRLAPLFAAFVAFAAEPGAPLPGITSAELELFRLGREDFNEVETAEEGLGPVFNGTSCGQCHSVPAIGGIATMTEVRAGHVDAVGKFTALNGETLYSVFSIGKHECQIQIPREANVIARRVPTPLFGAGLIEAIPDAAILALEKPVGNPDGVKGRASRITDVATRQPRIGRFGWKAQQATLLAFSADAYRNEMGITSDLFPDELGPGLTARQLKLCDSKPDPEDVRSRVTGLRAIDNFENFMKFLAPLDRGAAGADTAEGERLFASVGCAACHVPSMTTGPSANPLFDRKSVNLYSDLLLHDVGTGDGIEQADANGDEMRTPPLWGLRFRRPLLHDGSAATALEAIRRHGVEAEAARSRFLALEPAEQGNVLVFLGSL